MIMSKTNNPIIDAHMKGLKAGQLSMLATLISAIDTYGYVSVSDIKGAMHSLKDEIEAKDDE
jgi:hypothetical protein